MKLGTSNVFLLALWLCVAGAMMPMSSASLPDVRPQSSAELLEKAIYSEEITGDFDGAMKIYRQILEAADAQRGHAAQAQLRLGSCLMKLGKRAEACAELEKVLQKFPESKDVVALAKKRLAECAAKVDFIPAPWPDGEFQRMRLKMESGMRVGAITTHATAAVADGRNVWKLDVRRFVPVSGNNQGISRVTTDRATLQPFASSFLHTLIGNVDAVYADAKVTVTMHGKEGPKVQEAEVPAGILDNEEVFFAMRALPLADGYKTNLSVMPTFSCATLEFEIVVGKVETLTVPAGTFECFRLDLSVAQTFWISTGPDRRIVRFEAGGVIAELAEYGILKPLAPISFRKGDLAFRLTPPEGWDFLLDVLSETDEPAADVQLLDADVRTSSIAEVRRAEPGEVEAGIVAVAKKELEGVRSRFKSYALQDGSWTEKRIGDRPAVSFAGDYEQGDKKMTQYRVYMLDGDVVAELIFRLEAAEFAAHRATFDAIVESFALEAKAR